MSKEFFSRHEIKYLITFDQYESLAEALIPYTRLDSYGNDEGKYNIVSLYFDSNDYKIYYETRNKLRFRQKLRLRIYNKATTEDQAFFEIKQKFKNVVNKRRTRIKLGDAYQYIDKSKDQLRTDKLVTGKPDLSDLDISNPQIMNEIDSFKHLYHLDPKVIVSYDRQAFQGVNESDLRITFDYNLMCRNNDLRIENGPEGDFFVDPNLVILEVKVTHSVPFWLSRMLSEFECPKKSVSKYCTSIDHTTALSSNYTSQIS